MAIEIAAAASVPALPCIIIIIIIILFLLLAFHRLCCARILEFSVHQTSLFFYLLIAYIRSNRMQYNTRRVLPP